jgi:hypothetical protein
MWSENKQREPGCGFIVWWTLACLVGLAVGFALWGIIHDTFGEQSAGQNILFSLIGAIAGTLQWLVLRRYISDIRGGIIGGSIGCAIGLIIGFFMGGVPFDFILGFIGFGLGSGIGQWLGLRHLLERSWRWILATSLGFGIAGIVAVFVAIGFGDTVDVAFGSGVTGFGAVLIMLGSVGGAVGGLITAAMLVYLLRQSVPKAEFATNAS